MKDKTKVWNGEIIRSPGVYADVPRNATKARRSRTGHVDLLQNYAQIAEQNCEAVQAEEAA